MDAKARADCIKEIDLLKVSDERPGDPFGHNRMSWKWFIKISHLQTKKFLRLIPHNINLISSNM